MVGCSIACPAMEMSNAFRISSIAWALWSIPFLLLTQSSLLSVGILLFAVHLLRVLCLLNPVFNLEQCSQRHWSQHDHWNSPNTVADGCRGSN